jgi:hypothetical protein
LLIAMRAYLVQAQRAAQLGLPALPGFTRWFEERRELGHLLNALTLDT